MSSVLKTGISGLIVMGVDISGYFSNQNKIQIRFLI